MQRGLGIVALLAVLVAGARFTAGPSLSKTSERSIEAPAQHLSARVQPLESGCEEFSEHTRRSPSTPGEIAALIDRYRDVVPGEAPAQWSLPAGMHVLLLMVPDPLHTHLNLQFDRTIEAFQEAAQDEFFTYDSSWLPWKAQVPEYSA